MNWEARIKLVAEQARKDFEDRRIERALLKDLYLAYNPEITNIDRFLTLAEELFPDLNCGLAMAYLKHQLKCGEIHHGRFDRQPHTYLRIGSMIVDITADQFGGPPIYAGPAEYPWQP